MPRTAVPKKKKRLKKPNDLRSQIATDPELFTIEVGPAEKSGTFEISIYASSEKTQSTGMSKPFHKGGFKSMALASEALLEKLRESTVITDTRFTKTHLSVVQHRLSSGSKSYSIALREIISQTN